MISSREAQEIHAALLLPIESMKTDKSNDWSEEVEVLEHAAELAYALVTDLTGNPNVVERTAKATFDMNDLVPLLPVGEPPVEP
jgi:hypothetical protein